jgi:hypothetical protein
MMNSETSPRQQLSQAISDLSDRQIILLLQWVETLQNTPTLSQSGGFASQSDRSSDPLSEFVGATNHGDLATAIDESLYG